MTNYIDPIEKETEILLENLAQDIGQFLEDTKGDNILQVVLRGHLYIERELNYFLEVALENPEELIKGRTFYGQKLNIACAIGILSKDDKKSFEKIGELRNSYAHKWGFELEEENLDNLSSSFRGKLKEFYDNFNELTMYDLISRLKTIMAVMFSYLKFLCMQYKTIKRTKEIQLESYELYQRAEELEQINNELLKKLLPQESDNPNELREIRNKLLQDFKETEE
ncbi:hypothetical protein V7165_02850 [Priestia megaterium]|uniref:hypothetical protein n=1 Tax=Priestia megaterium TaxID=1404 RepID=UPI0030093557